MTDHSDLIAAIECQIERHGLTSWCDRIVNFKLKIAARDRHMYWRWQELPIVELEKILGALENG
jgi:hypothetical protein